MVVMSGGKSWQGTAEAVAMANWWRRETAGWSTCELLLEEKSLTTRENARYVSALLRERGLSRVGLVTCDYHMNRACLLFRAFDVEVAPLPAVARRSMAERWKLGLRERAALLLNRFQGGLS